MNQDKEALDELKARYERDLAEREAEQIHVIAAKQDDDDQNYYEYLADTFTEREARLLRNCIDYAEADPAGVPGHNLMILCAKLAKAGGIYPYDIGHAHRMMEETKR